MRTLVKKLLDQELSRRTFGKKMMALGFSNMAIDSLLNSMAESRPTTTFNQDRHLNLRDIFKQNCATALAEWRQLTV